MEENKDYIGEDGLLRCGKCHTRKQRLDPLTGNVYPCYCNCEIDAWEEEQKKMKARIRIEEIKSMRKDGIPDETLLNCRFANDDNKHPEASEVARKYVQNFDRMYDEGKGLMFYGNVGTGKTFLAACIANELIDQGYPVLVTTFTRIANRIAESSAKQEYIDSLNHYDLLVIDDLATERNTEFMNEVVYSVIDARYRAMKPVIVTTNLSKSDTDNANNARQRIYSRLREMTFGVRVVGEDRRSWGKAEELMKLLGL